MIYQHWQLTTDKEDILWLTFDRQGKSANTFSKEVFQELEQIIQEIEAKQPAAVILRSGKKSGFIAGADITQFLHLQSEQEAFDLIRQGQLIFDRWEKLPVPTIAMISGFCLGGGTEFALACTYRVASEDAATKLGLPEVKLGIHPGWGGTVRLPKLIGAPKAMSVMLTGSMLSARAAKRIGMIDAAVPERQLEHAARYYATQTPRPHRPKLFEKLTNQSWIRPLLTPIFNKQLSAKIRPEHYPAPFAIVKNWRQDGAKGALAMENEARSIARLMMTPQAKQLVRVFFLQEQLKALTKNNSAQKIQSVHVIGAGTMGGDIAAWCALKGMQVTLQDTAAEKIAPAIKRAHKLYTKKLKEPRLVQAALDRLQPDLQGNGLGRADLVIEAIFENLEVKRELFKGLEAQTKSSAILATNTSSIPINEIATALNDPSRLVGIHFFNPVALMPLVEVVRGEMTSVSCLEQAMTFVGQIGKLPLPVKSSPGFLVNRLLMPYLMEAMELLEEGVSANEIDRAATEFGMPMGPIELADKVGLDVCLFTAENLCAHLGGQVPNRLREIVAAGRLGVKTGAGFYEYKNGKPIRESAGQPGPEDMTDRLILRMANEAVEVLSKRVVESHDLLDAGMVFGTGFAPFRGGVTAYIDARGPKDIKLTLESLAGRLGDRFKLANGWQEYDTTT